MDSLGKIFMLDDDGIILDLYKELFEAKGYEVFATTNAYKLLLYAKEISPDIFILDVNMPGVSGWEVLQKINQDDLLREIPVLMLSVSRDIDLAIAKGAAHFLNKPVELKRLNEIIESYCIGSKHHDLLLLEDFDALNSPFEKSVINRRLNYFGVHDLRAAKRYLQKNLPEMVCVCYSQMDFDEAKKQLKHDKIYRVDRDQNINDILPES